MLFLPALLVALVTFAAAHVLPQAKPASHAVDPVFPLEIQLRDWQTGVAISRPVGVVAGFDTTLYIVSQSGQIFLADVKSGKVSILNPGGDDQRFAGVCLDSRGPGTLYATGADTGIVFAFNRRGELLERYQVTTPAEDGGTSFLANCIQTRYQLLITDAYNPVIYYLELADEGPRRGHPSVPNRTTTFQGVRMKYDGDWRQVGDYFNAYGVEWSQKFNETAYVMNSATGQLFTMGVKADKVVSVMEKVEVEGNVKLFPGALHILFDSTNENVLYISMPHLNAIAVLEVSGRLPGKAKFIRYLTSTLIDGPVAIGEYGDWIFPISGYFKRGRPRKGIYTIVQMPRHAQLVSSDDPDEEFTTYYDDKNETKTEVVPRSEVQEILETPPRRKGKKAPPLVPKPSANSRPPEKPGAESSDTDEDDSDSTSPTNPDKTRAPSSSNTPVATPAPESSEEDSTNDDRPDSIFGSGSLQPEEEDERACFPADASVHLENGLTVAMSELQIGDRVMCGWDESGAAIFSDVYMFSHQDKGVMSSFVSIRSSDGESLEISPSHYMYVNGRLATASIVRPGDSIGTRNGESIRANSVRRVRRRGLYNPQTLNGNIVVRGLRVSTYTSAVEPVVASALMSPFRAVHTLYRGGSNLMSYLLSQGSERIPELLPRGRLVYL